MKAKKWLKSEMPILAYETDVGWPSPRKQRLFAAACCRSLLQFLPDGRWHDCVAVAERFADRQAKRDELAAICPRVQREMALCKHYSHVVRETAEIAVLWLCETRKRDYAGQVAFEAVSAMAYSALPPNEPNVPPVTGPLARRWAEAASQERAAQIGLLDEVCGNQFRELVFSPAWRTATAVALARQMYDSSDFSAMPILADALQDAGCESKEILNHCRGSAPHVRGAGSWT